MTDPKPEPSAEPDPELCFWLTPDGAKTANIRLSSLANLLASQGLTIVPTADVPTAEERRILRALAAMSEAAVIRFLPSMVREPELARRAAKGKP